MGPTPQTSPGQPAAVDLRQMQLLAVRWTQVQPIVAAFIAGTGLRHHDAEDVLQRTAASLVTLLDQFDPARPFTAWAMGVARIEVLRFRQERRREPTVFDTETVEAVAQAFERTEPQLTDARAAMAGCVGKLRGRLRQVFEMRYVQGQRPAAIAAELGRTPQAVFAALHRGRLSVRACVERGVTTGGVARRNPA